MKIFILFRSVANRGGTERTLIDKANFLAENGHDVTFVTYEQRNHPYAYPLSASLKHVDLNCCFYTVYKYSLLRRIWEKYKMKRKFKDSINAIVDKEKPDVLVATTYTYAFLKGLISVKPKVKIILESHIAAIQDTFSGGKIKRMLKMSYMKEFSKCDLLISLTERDASFWRQYIHNVLVIGNPLSFYSEQNEITKKEIGRIISVGRLHSQKRFDRLIDAFSIIAGRYPDWHVVIFGQGQDCKKLQDQIDMLGLHNQVILCGSTTNIQEEYLKSQFYVLSSDYEGFPLVIIEAMACGVPVVSVNCPYGPSEVITDGKSGLLAEMNVKDLAEKMEWMILHEKERIEMGRLAHEEVSKYKKDVVMRKWENAYASVLN